MTSKEFSDKMVSENYDRYRDLLIESHQRWRTEGEAK